MKIIPRADTKENCVRGESKTAGGYHWEYVEEENEKE